MAPERNADPKRFTIDLAPVEKLLQITALRMRVVEALVGRELIRILETRYPDFTLEQLVQRPGNVPALEAIMTSVLESLPEYGVLCGRTRILQELKTNVVGEPAPTATRRAYFSDTPLGVAESAEEGGL